MCSLERLHLLQEGVKIFTMRSDSPTRSLRRRARTLQFCPRKCFGYLPLPSVFYRREIGDGILSGERLRIRRKFEEFTGQIPEFIDSFLHACRAFLGAVAKTQHPLPR